MYEYSKELHETYILAVDSFTAIYPPADKGLLSNIDYYSRACAMCLWGKAGVEVNKAVLAVNEIYSSIVGRVEYIEDNVCKSMEYHSAEDHFLPVPPFFYTIISYDTEHGTNYSRKLAASFQRLDVVYLLIDDEIQKNEAELIASMQSMLLKECDKNSIVLLVIDSPICLFSSTVFMHSVL